MCIRDRFTVEVSAGSNTHLYNLKAESTTLDCPNVWVDVVSDEVDCTSNSPTITVTFTNNSETAIDLGFFTQLNPPAGSGDQFLLTQTQRAFLPADGEETRTFSLKKNWTFDLTWSAAVLGTETAFTASGQFPDSEFGSSVYCPTEDSVFEPVVEITAQCATTGTTVTVTVDNTGSEVDAVATWTYAGGEGPGADEEIVPAGDVFEHEEEAVHDETWIVSVRADADEGAYSGESPIMANVKVDCPRPKVLLSTECTDGKLNVKIDNSDLEFDATLTVTELSLIHI